MSMQYIAWCSTHKDWTQEASPESIHRFLVSHKAFLLYFAWLQLSRLLCRRDPSLQQQLHGLRAQSFVSINTVLEVYRAKDMSLVRVLPSVDDEINTALFHPFMVWHMFLAPVICCWGKCDICRLGQGLLARPSMFTESSDLLLPAHWIIQLHFKCLYVADHHMHFSQSMLDITAE